MDFRKYILETERIMTAPVTGDDFDFRINESLSIECKIVDHTDNSYTIQIDEAALRILSEMNMINESQICTECGMGSMYLESNNSMRCDECGYSMAMEAATPNLVRARELDLHKDIGDGYYIGSDLHDDGDSRKVSYSLYKLEDPVGLQDQFANAWRDVGFLQVSPYRASTEEIMAAAAQLKIKDKAMHMQREAADDEAIPGEPTSAAMARMNQRGTDQEKADFLGNYMKSALTQGGFTDGRFAKATGVKESFGNPFSKNNFRIFVKESATGITKRVNFTDKLMTIRRDNPASRSNFIKRHSCIENKNSITEGYWACKMWSNKPVSKILKGK